MAVLEELLEPISEERPGGTDIFYEDDFAELENLRERTDDTQERNPDPDHEGVVEVARRILTEKSKDVRVALFLSEALLHTDGFLGFHSGLDLVHALLVRFWDHAHPEEPEDRAYALDFLEGGLSADSRTVPEVVKAVELYPLTTWSHHVHHWEEWKKSKGEEGGKKGSSPDEGDDSETSAANFGKGLHDTDKAYYKELNRGIHSCREAVEALDELGRERFQDVGFIPRYAKLKARLDRVGKAVEALLAIKLEQDPDPVEEAVVEAPGEAGDGGPAAADAGAGASASPAGAAPAGTLTPEPRDPADAAGRIGAAARFLRREDPTSPAPYLLLRGFRWGELRSGDGLDLRLLEAPDTALRTRLKTLLLDENWEELLDACEEVMAGRCGRGWIDLQRYCMTALDNLGSAYGEVSDAIRGQLAVLIRDVPRILEVTLMDDTPTANRETLRWLEWTGVTEVAEEGEGPAEAASYDDERMLAEATHERALEWVASGNARKGIELLKKRSEHEDSERGRFMTETLAASIMVDAGMTSVARPLLNDLVAEINTRKLEEWEPAEIVARPLGLLYRCLEPNDRQRQQLYDQICRLDPVLAMTLDEEAAPKAAPPQQPAAAAANAQTEDEGSSGDTEDGTAVGS